MSKILPVEEDTMKPTYDEVIQVMTEAAMGAFHEADEAGRSPEECWKASQEAAIRAMQPGPFDR